MVEEEGDDMTREDAACHRSKGKWAWKAPLLSSEKVAFYTPSLISHALLLTKSGFAV